MMKPLTLLLLLASFGCSLRYDFTECRTNEDCIALEVPGTFYECQESTCRPATEVACRTNDDCTQAPRTTCTQNQCVDPNPPVDMTPDMPDTPDVDMPPDTCTKNSECIARLGETYACGADGACFDLLGPNQECAEANYPESEKDNVVFVGAMLPLIEPFGTGIGIPLRNSLQLGIDAFNKEGGLPDGRKIAWVLCDTQGQPDISTAAATHLAQNVGVPAIVGPIFSEAFIAVVSNVTNKAENKILTFQPAGTSPSIQNLHGADKLVWRNIASDIYQGYATVKRIQDTGLQKILILFKDDKYGQDLQSEVVGPLRQDLGMTNVRIAKYADPISFANATPETLAAEYGQTLANVMFPDLQDMATWFIPDLTYIIGTSEAALAAGAYFNITASRSITPGRVLFSHGAVAAMTDLADSLEEQGAAGVIPLIEAVAPRIFDPFDPVYQNYALQYNVTFGDNSTSLVGTTSFDAIMAILFSMSAIPDGEEITGPKIASNMPKLQDKDNGTRVEFFSTSYISTARTALAGGGTVDLLAVSGEMDFNLDKGEVTTDYFNWTIVPKGEMLSGYNIIPTRRMTFPNAPETTDGVWAPYE